VIRGTKRQSVFIIAEAGINHNGSLKLAKKMIDVAAEAGADAVKFQTFKAERLVSKFAPKADYQKRTTGSKESQLAMLKKVELDISSHQELIKYCKKRRIAFLSSPFDLESIEFLDELGLEVFKIPSGEITNLPYLRKIGKLKKKVILSTGMANLKEIRDALEILRKAGTSLKNITVLHCNTEYPTPMEDVNLLAMLTIKKTFGVKVGYSDHTLGIEVPIAAVALGSTVIEKHFTLNKSMEGPDHKASLDPTELTVMVKSIRNIEKALGKGVKNPSPSELKNKKIVRKSIVALRDIKKGELFKEENITVKRPAFGINPMEWDNIIGKFAPRDFKEDELIEL
jgi:N,N'-diacetyllegionaminate synthase